LTLSKYSSFLAVGVTGDNKNGNGCWGFAMLYLLALGDIVGRRSKTFLYAVGVTCDNLNGNGCWRFRNAVLVSAWGHLDGAVKLFDDAGNKRDCEIIDNDRLERFSEAGIRMGTSCL